MLDAFADLADPRLLTQESLRAGAELVRVAVGASDLAPPAGDRRFTDPAWTLNPLYRRIAQTYLVWTRALERLAEAPRPDGDWRRTERARYAPKLLADATAPTHLPAGKPAAPQRPLHTGRPGPP